MTDGPSLTAVWRHCHAVLDDHPGTSLVWLLWDEDGWTSGTRMDALEGQAEIGIDDEDWPLDAQRGLMGWMQEHPVKGQLVATHEWCCWLRPFGKGGIIVEAVGKAARPAILWEMKPMPATYAVLEIEHLGQRLGEGEGITAVVYRDASERLVRAGGLLVLLQPCEAWNFVSIGAVVAVPEDSEESFGEAFDRLFAPLMADPSRGVSSPLPDDLPF